MDSITIYKKAFGSFLRIARNASKLTVEEIAKRVGISSGTYRNLESGQRIPTVEQIEGFAELFDYNFCELLNSVSKVYKSEVIKLLKIEGKSLEGKEYVDYLTQAHDIQHSLFSKWKKDKEDIESKVFKLAKDLIQACQRHRTPNKYLSENDINNLSEDIITLIDLRVKQSLRKHKKQY